MDLQLAGRVAVVTGGSSGIGAATARVLAAEGVHVAVCARRKEALDHVVQEITSRGGKAAAFVADTGFKESVDEMVLGVANYFGGIDILVNSAGASVLAPLEDMPDERWLADINVKLLGYVRCIRACLPYLERAGNGCVVNISGNAGRQPLPNHLPGGAANAGILNLTVALGQYLGPKGVRVVGVAPGVVETPRFDRQLPILAQQLGVSLDEARVRMASEVPVGRLSTAEDVAILICFLVSSLARQITGTTITIDGGSTRGI